MDIAYLLDIPFFNVAEDFLLLIVSTALRGVEPFIADYLIDPSVNRVLALGQSRGIMLVCC